MRTWGGKCGEIPHGAALFPQTGQRPPLIALITVPKPRRTSDATLVRRSQQGDRRAFSALLGRYDWRLRGLAHALLLDRAEMDVALATGYLRAWRDVVRVDAKEDVAAWLYRVTYNACIDQLRRAENASSSAPSAAPDAPASAVAEAASSAGSGIAAGLATLPAAERVAVVLVDREGFSPASAARILGMPESALSVTLDSARERLTPHIPEPDSEVPTVDDAAEPADASGNGSHPNDPPVQAPARADGATDVGTDGDGDATTASDDEDAAPSTDRLAPVEASAATDGDGVPGDDVIAGASGTSVTTDGDEDPGDDVIAGPSVASAATDGDEVAGDDAIAGPGVASAATDGDGATVDRDGAGNGDNRNGVSGNGDNGTGASGNGNGATGDGATGNGNEDTDGNGSRSADRNRGKGRRARRRAQHAAGQPQAEGPATPRDDTT